MLRLIVRRPVEEEREVLAEATLDETEGLVGETLNVADYGDGSDRFDTQLTLMNALAASLIAGERTGCRRATSSTSS